MTFPLEYIASIGMMVLLVASLFFHVLVLFNVIPYTIVWGGRIQNRAQLYRFEAVSIAVNLLFLGIILVHSRIIMLPMLSPVAEKIGLWLMFALFLLNTVGNLLSKNRYEKLIFTPITLLSAVFCLILAWA